jgi:hypothetical protein
MRKLFALFLIMCVAASCSRNRRPSDALDSASESTLHVENQGYGDVDIFVIHDGSRSRIGTVTASSDQTFTLNPRIIGTVGTMQLLAHAVGTSGSLSSEQFAIRPGMQITWTLDSSLSRAMLAIY